MREDHLGGWSFVFWRVISKLRSRRRRTARGEGEASVKGRAKGRKARQPKTSLQRPKLVFALAAVGTAFIIFLTLFGRRSLIEVYALKRKIQDRSEEIAFYEKKNQEIREQIENLKHDPFTVEQIAREELGLVRPGETVYEFVDEPHSSSRKE